MYKTITTVLLILCTINLCWGQDSRYKESWRTIHLYEIDGKIASALEETQSLVNQSKRKKDYNTYLKAKIYRWKFLQINTENSNNLILEEVNTVIKDIPFPYKAILATYKAKWLTDYYKDNRWSISRRGQIDNPDLSDIETWDLMTLLEEIRKTYQFALAKGQKLIIEPAGNFEVLLQTAQLNRKYRPSLYDILAHESLDFYKNNFYNLTRPNETYELTNEKLFGLGKTFTEIQFKTPDSLFSKVDILKEYQNLERLHQGDQNSEALVFTTLQRLEYVFQNHQSNNKWQLYEKTLLELEEAYMGKEIQGLIRLKLAEKYRDLSDTKLEAYTKDSAYTEEEFERLQKLNNGNWLLKYPDYNSNAIKLSRKIVADFPESAYAIKAAQLLEQLQKPELNLKSEEIWTPDEKGRLLITYKNIDTLTLKIYKANATILDARDKSYFQDSILKDFIQIRPQIEAQILLPKSQDHNQHSTETILPALEKGSYLIYASSANIPANEGSYSFINVSELTASLTDYDRYESIQVLNRTTGLPIKNAEIKTYIILNRGEYANKVIDQLKHTDKNGIANLLKRPNDRRLNNITIKTPSDSTNLSYYPGYYRSLEEIKENTDSIARTVIYTDRAIYRPGQKVYFKGILLLRLNGEAQTVANEMISVFVENANDDEIEEFVLKTNEFGSFSGEFVLPKSGLNGDFSIYADENYDVDTFFYDSIDEFDWQTTTFKVEEYKRPTFEVTFTPLEEAFMPGDSIQVQGMAESFMGAKLSEIPVKYTITRTKQFSYWRYGGSQESLQIANDSIATNNEGSFEIKFASDIPAEDEAIYSYKIYAEVTDLSGETRSASTTVRIGNKNLIASLRLPQQTLINDSLDIYIESKNLNDQEVTASGTLKIYKLQAPDRILGERLWEAPEIQTISAADFKKAFPTEPYFDEQKVENWPKGKLLFETTFETSGSYKQKLLPDEKWPSGKYVAIINLKSENGATTETKETFDLTDTAAKSLPDHKSFEFSVLDKDLEHSKKIQLLLATGFDSLTVYVKAFDGQEKFYDKKVTFSGSKKLDIPYRNTEQNGTLIQIFGIKNGLPVSWQTTISTSALVQSKLNFSTKTFRNKMQPGVEETWSFTLKDDSGKTPDAEILASMYDASLDQFTTPSWETTVDFDDYYNKGYTSFPSFNRPQVNELTYFRNTFSNRSNYRNTILSNFDELKTFGFTFGQPNSYQYKRYVQTVASTVSESISLQGNTRGIVTDSDGQPLPGVTVIVKGTDTGTTTNFDGEFALDTKPGAVLVFNYIGFIEKQATTAKNKNLYIMLDEDSAHLDEVVVVGYGTQTKKNITGSVAMVQSESVESVLQGRVAGVEVSAPGASEEIRIRGAASVAGGKQALYIVDGVPVEKFDMSASEITSIDVLKDAASTALYGSRGANGVIVITTKKALDELTQVEARKNLDETAFFFPHIQTDKNGDFSFSFTTPEALTRWKLRLLAHDKNWVTGQMQQTAITQKELSIVPNAPRFLREEDTISFSAKITNLSSSTQSGAATLLLFDALTQEPIDTKLANTQANRTFNLSSKKSTAVSWDLIIPKDIEAVTYRVVAKAGFFSDGEENILPVLTNRTLVTESIPLFIRSGETKTFEFENLKNNTSKTLANHKFTLEYSSNPAWYAIQALPYLMEFEHDCSEQIFSRIYANTLGSHIVTSDPKIADVFKSWKKDSALVSNLDKNEELKNLILAETPWVRDAESETDRKNRIAQLFEVEKLKTQQQADLAKLENSQLDSGAFPWFSGGPASEFITRHIVGGFGHLKKLGVTLDDSGIPDLALVYLDTKLIRDKNKFKTFSTKPEDFYKQRGHLHYLYARSYYLEEAPLNDELKVISTKILNYHENNWQELSVYEKGMFALVANRMGKTDLATKIMTSLKESAVYSETNGMYWKSNRPGWYWYQAPIETHALIIEAFTEITQDTEVLEELKVWLLQNKRTNSWPTTKSTTEAAYALLLSGNDWLSVTDNTKIELGGTTLKTKKLEESDKEAGTGYLKLNWNAEEIDETFASIEIKNKNTSPGFGGAYWQYFEDFDQIKSHTESPLNVEQQLYLKENGPTGATLKQIDSDTPIKVGDLITVRLVVRATSDMEFIHLKDIRASGFEPVNVLSKYKYQDRISYYESTRDAATHFFFDTLRKGTYVLEYNLRANNAGNFSNGITTIESMYAPEFSGHTKGIRVNIDN
ncbi:MG2 domain-containing protein [Leeuwenhoekiella marinoflava]|uniref:alpha-2-macroglobulin family protein n=1 Tax=Leeuwenhoekiella marinoflava TaxID=988 RepID=UPI003002B397